MLKSYAHLGRVLRIESCASYLHRRELELSPDWLGIANDLAISLVLDQQNALLPRR
jgi:hypothetical protein